ncbi:MAG TPA: NAD(P)H-binding protein [Micropruina sp.]|nr:NAD(P)H-binding protein [Micropruina sp.]
MARITVIGGTGYGGAAVVREAAKRGHTVTSISRTAPAEAVEGVTYVQGSVLDHDVLSAAVAGADVVFEAVAPRGDMTDKVDGLVADLVALADQQGVRVGFLGGVSSMLASEGGPRLFDLASPPAEVLPEIEVGLRKLATLKAAPESVDWFYVSPAAEFGSWLPQRVTGSYRISDDVLLTDDNGTSYIAAPDLALAVLDEIEHPAHRRARFHVAL